MPILKKVTATILALLLITALGIVIWNNAKPPSLRGTPDPALAYINQNSSAGADEFRDFFFDYQGTYLHVIEGGNKAKGTILFLHGFPSFWYSFARQMEAFSDQYQVIAIDGLGAGKSDTPTDLSHYQQQAMAQHILALMDSLEAEQFHIVGHDWGSALALGIAQQNPARTLSVTGISAPPQNTLVDLLKTNQEQQQKYAYVKTLKGANPLLLKLFSAPSKIYQGAYAPLVNKGLLKAQEGELFKYATANVKRLNSHINWYRANLPDIDKLDQANYWPQPSPSFSMPTLLVWGNDDKTFSSSYLDILADAGPAVEILRFDSVGHWPHVERATQLNNALRRTLEKASSE